MRSVLVLVLVLASAACSERQLGGGENGEEGAVERSWSPCVIVGEYNTCEEVCQAQGTTCVASGCVALPMYCKPDDCDTATSVLSLGDAVCTDVTVGSYVDATCETPIEFIFNDTARCCCEG